MDKVSKSAVIQYLLKKTGDSRNKCSAFGTNKAENDEIHSSKKLPAMTTEPVPKSEGLLDSSKKQNALEDQEYYRKLEKMTEFQQSYRELRNTLECFASDEGSDDSSSYISSSDELHDLRGAFTMQFSSREPPNVRNMCQQDASFHRLNNKDYGVLSPDFKNRSGETKDMQNSFDFEALCLNLNPRKERSKSCDSVSGKVFKSRKKLDFSNADSSCDGVNPRRSGFSHSHNSIPKRNISSHKLDLPGPSNRDAYNHTRESPALKLFSDSNGKVRNANISPVSEVSVPSSNKTHGMDRSFGFELPGPSKYDVPYTEESTALNLSTCSNRNGRIGNVSHVVELPDTSNDSVYRTEVSSGSETPLSSESHVQCTSKTDCYSSGDEIQVTVSSKRKKRRRKSRKTTSFFPSDRNCCKSNSELYRVVDEESSSFSDSPKALKKYCAANSSNDTEGNSLETVIKLDSSEISNHETFETGRASRKRLVSHSENPEFEKLETERVIYKKIKRSKSSEK